jgi:hypothetical protein
MHELLPAVEEQFRGIGEGWARYDETNPCAVCVCVQFPCEARSFAKTGSGLNLRN